jgi:hypothetical protein
MLLKLLLATVAAEVAVVQEAQAAEQVELAELMCQDLEVLVVQVERHRALADHRVVVAEVVALR